VYDKAVYRQSDHIIAVFQPMSQVYFVTDGASVVNQVIYLKKNTIATNHN